MSTETLNSNVAISGTAIECFLFFQPLTTNHY